MYSIYHIPGIKIGCSTQPAIRVKNQGYIDFEILETHNDISIAAKREIELRNQYGYIENNVKTDYVQHYEYGKKGREAAKGLGAQSQIKNKIGIFGYSKQQRLEINTKANIIRAKISAEKRKRPILVYDYKTNNFIKEFESIKEAAIYFNLSNGNIHSVINGNRNHTKGLTFKLKIK